MRCACGYPEMPGHCPGPHNCPMAQSETPRADALDNDTNSDWNAALLLCRELERENKEASVKLGRLEPFLNTIHDYLLEREDLDDGDEGRQVANEEMSLRRQLCEAMGWEI